MSWQHKFQCNVTIFTFLTSVVGAPVNINHLNRIKYTIKVEDIIAWKQDSSASISSSIQV